MLDNFIINLKRTPLPNLITYILMTLGYRDRKFHSQQIITENVSLAQEGIRQKGYILRQRSASAKNFNISKIFHIKRLFTSKRLPCD